MNLHTRARGRLRLGATSALAITSLGAGAGLAATATADDGPPRSGSHYERLSGVDARNHILEGSDTVVEGTMRPKDKGRVVWIEARWRGSHGWRIVAKDKTGSKGRFHDKWEPPDVGKYSVRAVLTGSDAEPRRVKGGVTVYRAATASWYGPGLYGNRTACGQTLEPDTLGVAHKSLPCGTKVRFHYQGNTVTAPVIDRGPYVSGREWDLTAETKSRLNFPSTGTVWAAPQGG
ncbi:MAG TPA: septal ring lytic transglycosylase RlpA family protein [Thermoleophilaceae bacterium]|nr:septal ring lytic transglycosylase RlpA family protein [Thermoleophilaceae bacterium]